MCQGLRDGALDCLKGTVFVSELELVVGELRVWSWVTVTVVRPVVHFSTVEGVCE
jgi:hypothetical protein